MENVKGMFGRKYGGVPAWLIMLVAVGGVYLYMRHTGNSLFGGGSATGGQGTDPNADPGSTSTMDGQSPEIVFVPAGFQSQGNTSNPQNPHHPAGPPTTHTVTTAQRAAAIMRDFKLHGATYFKNHPNALAWLKINAPGDYKVVHAKLNPKPTTKAHIPTPKSGRPAKGAGSGKVAVRR